MCLSPHPISSYLLMGQELKFSSVFKDHNSGLSQLWQGDGHKWTEVSFTAFPALA